MTMVARTKNIITLPSRDIDSSKNLTWSKQGTSNFIAVSIPFFYRVCEHQDKK